MASQLDFAGGTFVDGLVSDSDEFSSIAKQQSKIHRRLVIAFVGLAFEARIAAGPGVLVACRTAGNELEKVATTAARQGYRGMISFGVAGGLASHLRAGDWVVASAIRESQTVRATDAVWSRKLLGMIDGAVHAPIVGVDHPVAEPAKKRELHRTTGAAAVDMESHHRRARRRRAPARLCGACGLSSIRRTAQCRRRLSSTCVPTAAPMFWL